MKRRSVITLGGATVGITAISGCLDRLTTGDQNKPESNTSTQDTTDDVETSTSKSTKALPPGVTQSGVEDAHALVTSHHNSLESESFMLESSDRRTRYENETIVDQGVRQATVEVAPDGEQFFGAYQHQNPGSDYHFRPRFESDTEWWANRDTVVYRPSTGDKRTVKRSNSPERLTWYTKRKSLEALLSDATLVSDESTAGKDRYWLQRTFDHDSIDASNGYVSSKITAIVNIDGTFDRARLVYLWNRSEGEQYLTRDFRFRNVGETTVERPDWADDV